MERSASKISNAQVPKLTAMALGKCLLCHIPQSDETLEGMIRFVTYPPSHTTDAGFQVLCANTIAPVVISANNMTDYEIINKADLKNNYGTGSEVMDALSRCRSLFSRVGKEWNDSSIQEKEYFLVKEFERHLKIVQDLFILVEKKDSSMSKHKVRKASELSPKPELNNHPSTIYPTDESDNDSNQNIVSEINLSRRNIENMIYCNTSPENGTLTQRKPSGVKRKSSGMSPGRSLINQNAWNKRYEELVDFAKSKGHAQVPYSFTPNAPLGIWVSTQRSNYNKLMKGVPSSMTEDKIRLLKKIGFKWDGSHRPWEKSYEFLVKFTKEYGHAQVPAKFRKNPNLANWVLEQRKHYKQFLKEEPSSMTESRIELLNKVGFEWDPLLHPWEKQSSK